MPSQNGTGPRRGVLATRLEIAAVGRVQVAVEHPVTPPRSQPSKPQKPAQTRPARSARQSPGQILQALEEFENAIQPSSRRAAACPPVEKPSEETCFVAFDTETTGLYSGSRIVEIAGVRYHGGREVGRFATLIDPGERIPREAIAIHGITDQMVLGKPGAREAIRQFLDFAAGAILIAHNASFDVRMVNGELQRHGMPPLGAQVLCSRTLARRHVPGLWDYKLQTVATQLGITKERQAHRALADALLVAGIALEVLRRVGAAAAGLVPPQPRTARGVTGSRSTPRG